MRKSFFLFAMAWAVTVAAAGKRPITETDLLKFQWVADPQISPDGREVTYVLVTVNENEDRYDTSLWQVATTGSAAPRRLTAGPRDSSPRWSPDGRSLAFTRAAGEKDKPQIYLLSMSGGEARRLTDVPRGAGAALWSPNGKTIAFTSETSDEDLAERKAAKGKDPKEVEVEKESGTSRASSRAPSIASTTRAGSTRSTTRISGRWRSPTGPIRSRRNV